MKILACALIFLPFTCAAAESLFPIAEGTTWKYQMKQERPSGSLDLEEPNEEEEFEVTYRLGGVEKIDNVELRRLEVYRGDTLENVDLIAIEERGISCPARKDAKGALTKLVPPQQMLAFPLKSSASWMFNGTVGDTNVEQRYLVAGQEDIEVPAGKFHAWKITCAQLAPTKGVIERWFVPGAGFVKIDTALKGPSDGILERSSLQLKEPPKIAIAPEEKNSVAAKAKLSAGVSSEPNGEFKTEFKSDTPAIHARWRGRDLPEKAEIRAVFIAENVADVSADYQIDEAKAVAPEPNSSATFTLSKPESSGWTPGNYRVEFFVDDEPAATVKFKISK